MTTWVIGDIQGSYDGLYHLLKKIGFRHERDRLWFTGDLVNRGGQSLEVLRMVHAMRDQCEVVLGNHDLSLLAYAHGVHKSAKRNREFKRIMRAVDGEDLIHWLQHRKLLHVKGKVMMVHAGLAPAWGWSKAQKLASEVEAILHSDQARDLLENMWHRSPARWSNSLEGLVRARVILNHFTRIRYCRKNGGMDYRHNGPPGSQPDNLCPWFEHPKRKLVDRHIIFGHWSTLGYFHEGNVTCLDTGYVWGRQLTAIRPGRPRKPVQVTRPSD